MLVEVRPEALREAVQENDAVLVGNEGEDHHVGRKLGGNDKGISLGSTDSSVSDPDPVGSGIICRIRYENFDQKMDSLLNNNVNLCRKYKV